MDVMVRIWSLAAIALLAPMAHAQAGLGGGKAWNVHNQVNFQSFLSGTNSQIRNPEMTEILSENDFQVYWTRLTGQPAQNAPRNIDWKREKLLAIQLGARRTSGYSVMVQNIEKQGSFALVTAIESVPSRNQAVAQNITYPYTIVKVDRIVVPFRLNLQEREGMQIGGANVIITAPGTAIVSPQNYERPGGGYVDPRFQIPYRDVYASANSRATQKGLLVINSAFQWQATWQSLTGEPGPSAPDQVDWRLDQLVVVQLGPRDTTGYSVEVLGVERTSRGAVVRAVEVTPVPGSSVRRRKTSPFAVIVVRRGNLSYSLDLQQRERGPGTVRIIEGDGRGL